jgi:hypothetical protein
MIYIRVDIPLIHKRESLIKSILWRLFPKGEKTLTLLDENGILDEMQLQDLFSKPKK